MLQLTGTSSRITVRAEPSAESIVLFFIARMAKFLIRSPRIFPIGPATAGESGPAFLETQRLLILRVFEY